MALRSRSTRFEGRPPGFSEGEANHAFRFPAVQADKIRACDDLKYGCVNPRYAERTPPTLPTWGHIGEIRLRISDADRPWSFLKTDRESAYKNRPLSADSSKLCLITLRNPKDGIWYGFWHRALLFGAPAAVLRYNAFSRIVAALANKIFGLLAVNYFDDIGRLMPSSIEKMGF